jgi:hypothetical protein
VRALRPGSQGSENGRRPPIVDGPWWPIELAVILVVLFAVNFFAMF